MRGTLNLERLERLWIALGTMTLVAFFVVLLALALAEDVNPPSYGRTVDPTTVAQTAPFDRPGLRRTGHGTYDAYYVGRVFAWSPHEITVPVGATVTFYVTSADVVHGFTIPEEDVNVEILPGWVSSVRHTFRHAGDFLILCNQYCGIGHQAMSARVVVREELRR